MLLCLCQLVLRVLLRLFQTLILRDDIADLGELAVYLVTMAALALSSQCTSTNTVFRGESSMPMRPSSAVCIRSILSDACSSSLSAVPAKTH